MKPEEINKQLPTIEHHVWEEDGQQCSSWTITINGRVIRMGDAGMELFQKYLREWANSNYSDFKRI